MAAEYDDVVRSIWVSQHQELQRLAEHEGLPILGERGNLKSAARFGEMLTLAPDISNAVRLIKEDHEGALSFLDVAANMNEAVADASERPSTSELSGPFHELADLVVEFLGELKELDPTKFE